MARIVCIDTGSYRLKLSEPYRSILADILEAAGEVIVRRQPQCLPRKGTMYSPGLLSVAAALCSAGHEIIYISCARFDESVFSESVAQADYLIANTMTATVEWVNRVFLSAKGLNSGITTVVGGPHASALPERTLDEFAAIDIVVVGQAELSILELLDSPLSIQSDSIPGAISRKNSGLSQLAYCRPDLEKLPMPAYDILPMDLTEYAHNVSIHRGCPFGCNFCVDGNTNNYVQSKSIQQILNELDYLNDHLPSGTVIQICDSIFPVKKDYTIRLCGKIAEMNLGLRFICDVRHEYVDPQIIRAMSKAGFIQFNIGFEDRNESILALTNKRSSWETNLSACQTIRENSDTIISAYWITGLPGTSQESINENIRAMQFLIHEKIVDLIGCKIFVPYPGTPYFQFPQRYGLRFTEARSWSEFDRHSLPVYELTTLKRDELYAGFLKIQRSILAAQLTELHMTRSDLNSSSTPVGYSYLYSNYVKL